MGKKVTIIIVFLSTCMSYGSIQPIVVDLSDLTGYYVFNTQDYGTCKTASFDLGQPIPFEIGAISLLIEGNYSPGVALLDGTVFTDPFHAGFGSEIITGGPMDVWWASLPYLTTSFQLECFYEQIGNASWDFLVDGEAEIPLNFSRTISWGTIIEQAPYAEVTNAQLKIHPVPEPATILLLSLGGLLLHKG